MYRLFNNYFYPDDAVGTGIGSAEMSKDDIIKFLGDDDADEKPIPLVDKSKDDKEIPKESKEEEVEDEESDTDEEDDELKEIEEELEEPDEEKLELIEPVSRREILTKFPKLFKEFPYLEKAMYREQQYTALLPTINDAKEAVEARTTLGKIELDIMNGDTEKLLTAAKGNEKAYNKIIDNYLTVLSKIDKASYHHVIGEVINTTIEGMAQEARNSNNDVLLNAAQILNQYVFGRSNYVAHQKLSKNEQLNTQQEELTRQQQEFAKQRFDVANNDLSTRVNNAFKSTIEVNIDPKGSMTEYNKRNAVRDAQEMLEKAIKSDPRFRSLVDKLWDASHKSNFNSDSVDKIRKAFLSKGKTLLPDIIRRARNDALKGMGKRVSSSDKDEEDTTPIKKGRDMEKPNSNNKGGIPAGMSTLEYLMKD